MKSILNVTCVVAAVVFAGCVPTADSQPAQGDGQSPVKIVCTTGMVADLVTHVGGDDVQVTTLMSAGVDPHLYKASPGDARLLQAADMVIYSGLYLEGKMTDIFERLSKQKPAFAVTAAMDEEKLLAGDQGVPDPHVWFDVELWSSGATVVRDQLSTFDPAHKEQFHQRCADYQHQLADLHAEIKAQLAMIPKDRRVLVTAHDAFRYFGRAYEIDVHGIQGISTESEAGVKQINQLVNFLIERKIKAVFVETSVSDQNVKSLIEGCAAQGHSLVIGGELYSDAMGTEGTPEGTYVGMVRHNVATIKAALE